jgi:hypothetical protein
MDAADGGGIDGLTVYIRLYHRHSAGVNDQNAQAAARAVVGFDLYALLMVYYGYRLVAIGTDLSGGAMNRSESVEHPLDVAEPIETDQSGAGFSATEFGEPELSWAILNRVSLRWAGFVYHRGIPKQPAPTEPPGGATMLNGKPRGEARRGG